MGNCTTLLQTWRYLPGSINARFKIVHYDSEDMFTMWSTHVACEFKHYRWIDWSMAVAELTNVSNQKTTSNLDWPQQNGIVLSKDKMDCIWK